MCFAKALCVVCANVAHEGHVRDLAGNSFATVRAVLEAFDADEETKFITYAGEPLGIRALATVEGSQYCEYHVGWAFRNSQVYRASNGSVLKPRRGW